MHICISDKCKDVSFSQIDWELVNHWPWIWHHLFSHSNICWFWDQISLLARKLWEQFYYSLFTNPFSMISIKIISGLCRLWASDATWKPHLKQTYFHFTCPIIQQLTAAEVTKPTLPAHYSRIIIEQFNACLEHSRLCEKVKDFTLISNACIQIIEGKIIMFVTLLWGSRKIRDYSSYELNYTEVLHS